MTNETTRIVPEIAIRDMERDDREAVIALMMQLNRFEDAISHDRVTDRAGAAACLADDATKMRERGGVQIVAEQAGRLVGYVCCAISEGGVFLRPEYRLYGYVHTLVVDEAARGQGIGEALMRAAETFTRSQGLRSFAVAHIAGNAGAARLYERLGLKPHAIDRVKWLD